MAGWTRKKRRATEKAFYDFLGRCFINSKDAGRICLGDNLYQGQRDCITKIFDALEQDIHRILILKSRQLGISTIIRALIIFLLGLHRGLKGAIVFDSESNKAESRAELEVMIEELPPSLGFPTIISNNRSGLGLANTSKVLFMSAGVKKTKTSGTLGRSVGLALAHCSELCSWDNDDGLEAFEQSLSEINPDRLYIFESTARGFNRWCSMWEESRQDPHCCCIFLGFWSKESQRIDRKDPDWALYGEQAPTDKELEKIAKVKELYDFDVSPEQLAWVRRKMDPTARAEGDAPIEYEGSTTRIQEQPWTEEEAFQQTGSVFFSPEQLTDLTKKWTNNKFKTYMFMPGQEFSDMKVYPASNQKSVEMKVWEEPDPDGVYAVAIDPAYGMNEKNDRSAIQVLRCYADGVDQVAEYAWPLVTTYQLAWVIAAIMGWYGQGPRAEVRYILELNGPGTAVFNELRSLKHKVENSPSLPDFDAKGLRDIFRNVRTYIYTRPDSMGPGYNYHFLTNSRLKVTLMERLRDFVAKGILRVRSLATVEEMRWVTREGDDISAPEHMWDDRVMSLAMGVHCWEEKTRRMLVTSRRTREAEEAKKRMTIVDQVAMFNQNTMEGFFAVKQKARRQQALLQARGGWRSGARRY